MFKLLLNVLNDNFSSFKSEKTLSLQYTAKSENVQFFQRGEMHVY